jgi:nucleoside-diphosphate-sugar epimerase
MQAEEVILVTGATGNTGSTLLQQLETRGGRVRAMVREQPDGGRLPWQVDGLTEDYAHYARGEADAISPHVREVTGQEPRVVRTFAKDYARVFVGV